MAHNYVSQKFKWHLGRIYVSIKITCQLKNLRVKKNFIFSKKRLDI
jgi:hypothetical protein